MGNRLVAKDQGENGDWKGALEGHLVWFCSLRGMEGGMGVEGKLCLVTTAWLK